MPLGLSKESLERRRKHVMAGDAKDLLEGYWNRVWHAKKGAPEEDLSSILPVQLGSMTEAFNFFWFEKITGREVAYCSDNPLMCAIWNHLTVDPENKFGREPLPEFMISKDYPFMGCNLDGMSQTSKGHDCVIDAKHVGKVDKTVIERYTPGMTHQAVVMGVDWWVLSCLVGNSKFEIVEQEVDPFYAGELIATCEEFWSYVERDIEPEDRIAPVPPPPPQKPLRTIDLNDDHRASWPNWGKEMNTYIADFKHTLAAATAHAITRDNIKMMLPEDVGLVTREDVTVSRAKNGAVTIAQKKEKADG